MKRYTQFTMIPYEWFGLVHKCNLDYSDINLLGVINSLSNTKYGCIADNEYFEGLLKVPNIRFNIERLQKADLIQINQGKVRKITINDKVLDSL